MNSASGASQVTQKKLKKSDLIKLMAKEISHVGCWDYTSCVVRVGAGNCGCHQAAKRCAEIVKAREAQRTGSKT